MRLLLGALAGALLLLGSGAAHAQSGGQAAIVSLVPRMQVFWSHSVVDDGPVDPVTARVTAIIWEGPCQFALRFDDSGPGVPFSSAIFVYFASMKAVDSYGSYYEFVTQDPDFMRGWHWGLAVPAGDIPRMGDALRDVLSNCGHEVQ